MSLARIDSAEHANPPTLAAGEGRARSCSSAGRCSHGDDDRSRFALQAAAAGGLIDDLIRVAREVLS
jgi:hypothetical protein